jgi:hypothetical protein
VALMLPPNWCLFYFRDPEAAFTTDRLRECLRAERLTVAGEAEPLAVRYGKPGGPTLYVSISRGSHLETIVRSLVGRGRNYRKLIPGVDTEVGGLRQLGGGARRPEHAQPCAVGAPGRDGRAGVQLLESGVLRPRRVKARRPRNFLG